MADYLPRELIALILLRLPSKSLISFRSVCKSWLSLFSSTQFKLMYLRSNFSRTLVGRVSWRENKEMYTVHFNDQHFTQDTRVSIEFPFNLHRGGIIKLRPIGSCNGVICLSKDIPGSDETILWNPSIRRKLTLIPLIHRYNDIEDLYLVFGFGYDKMTDDYKVVRLSYINSRSFPRPHVEVYTVKTAIWRVVEFPHDLPCYCLFSHCEHAPVFFNGSAHWIANSNSIPIYSSILTFDMSTERFGEIQLPENLAQEFDMRLVLVVVEESLGVIYSSHVTSTSSSYEIWGMKEYKNPASWTMLYNKHYPHENVGRALGLTDNGSLITRSQGDLKIYSQEGCYTVFGSGSEGIDSETISVVRYEESLALLDVGDDFGNEGRVGC